MTRPKRPPAAAALPERDKPWLIRTYSGHSTAAKSNELYRKNLAKGQTGLSIAFDLPTQTGYDADHELARGEVGKVGVPVSHLGDMRTLLADIPLDKMNTSMTINATAAWLLALYVATADAQGATAHGAHRHDPERHHQGVPVARHLRVPARAVAATDQGHHPLRWRCHAEVEPHQRVLLPPAGGGRDPGAGTGVRACHRAGRARRCPGIRRGGARRLRSGGRAHLVLRQRRAQVHHRDLQDARLHRALGRDHGERYGVQDAKHRRLRYGVQVNSLGLTEPQAENNVYRILIEMLAVTMSRDARARAVQLPAWNEALGLPRPWDQQWSIRMQQILAYETDLLEYADVFEGSKVIRAKVDELKAAALTELERIDAMGGAVAAIDYMKHALVDSNTERVRRIELGEQIVVGVNRWTETEKSPLSTGEGSIEAVDPAIEQEQVGRLVAWRAGRDAKAVKAALTELESAAREGRNVMEPSIACAKAGVTTGEWGTTLRSVFGEYRAPTGISGGAAASVVGLDEIRAEVDRVSARLGRRIKLLVGKPGLDGHSNGAEQIPLLSRRSIKMTPPKSRRFCTHPFNVTFSPIAASVTSPLKYVLPNMVFPP